MNFIEYKKAKIAFSDYGQGQTIVLLHGFLENSSMFDFFVNAFKSTHRLVTIDLLGHGQSDCVGYVHTMAEHSAMVLAVLVHLNIKHCSIVGHSMGGYVALAFAEGQPEMIQSLVLLNSTAAADSTEKKLNRDRAIKAVKQGYETFVRMAIANLFASKNAQRLANDIENTKIQALKTPLQGIIASLEGMKIRPDKIDFFRNLKAKKMLILGQADTVLNFDEARLQTLNANIDLVIFPDGHMTHLENRAELTKVFKLFFDQ